MYTVNCAVCGRGFHKYNCSEDNKRCNPHEVARTYCKLYNGNLIRRFSETAGSPPPRLSQSLLPPRRPEDPPPPIPCPAGHPSTLRPTTSTPINNLIQAEIYLRFSSHFSHLSCRQNATIKKLLAPCVSLDFDRLFKKPEPSFYCAVGV